MADPRRWSVVVPVKRTEVAKTRLGGALAPHRRDLALAFAADTVASALGCRSVAGVLVVTDDPAAAGRLRGMGAVVVGDQPDAGLNPALRHGAAQARSRWAGSGVALLSADLPALRADELADALGVAEGANGAFVCDARGIGTTLVTAAPGSEVVVAFGRRSRARHRLAGLVEVTGVDIPSVRRDVDTEVDLADAVRLGVGPATGAVLARMAGP
jgi:2-phospho-L-lactate guanylyltransferase